MLAALVRFALLLCIAGAAVAAPATAASPAAAAPPISVIPRPNKVELQDGFFAIRAGTQLVIPPEPRAARIARYFAELLRQTRGIELAPVSVQPDAKQAAAARPIVFKLEGHPANPEAYELRVSRDRIVVVAGDPRGLLYGAVTLWQLCTSGQGGDAISGQPGDTIAVPAVRIVDSPRFAWRGLLLDSARHYQSPEFILQFIDWMALHKLNVLHWHLTDDQGWRLEIKKYPRLTSVGARRADEDGFYSQETVRKIVAHATERNVTIVPEIDMPGHATAAIVAYPSLGSVSPAPAVVTAKWGVYSNLYNVDETTLQFLENVLSEVISLFPGKYVHIGGDEANEGALQSYFVTRIGNFLTAHHRRLVGWDELLEQKGLPADATIMSWRGIKGALAAAAAGRDAVLSPDPTLYLDNRQSATDTQPGRMRVVSLEHVYKFDPMPASLPADQQHHILGLQANIWTEHIRTEQRVEHMTFPRAAALAEVGWSAAGTLEWNGFLARLPDQMRRYRLLGIHAYEPEGAAMADAPPLRRTSYQLQSCTQKILLSLEDDAPKTGDRAAFQVDILNPCWIYEDADLSRVSGFTAAVGQVPFSFQVGADVHLPVLDRPRAASGELEVRLDSCDGEVIASLSIEPAMGRDGVTELPAVRVVPRAGRHDLCLKFAQWLPDPMWVIDWFQLLE